MNATPTCPQTRTAPARATRQSHAQAARGGAMPARHPWSRNQAPAPVQPCGRGPELLPCEAAGSQDSRLRSARRVRRPALWKFEIRKGADTVTRE